MSDGVHRTHCCARHGCKYGDADCPVERGRIVQDYLCESCDIDYVGNGNPVYTVTLVVRKWPTNEVEGLAWLPTHDDVVSEVAQALKGKDLDTGWFIEEVMF